MSTTVDAYQSGHCQPNYRRLSLHTTAVLLFLYTLAYDCLYVHSPKTSKSTKFIWKLKYLTYVNFVLQIAYYSMCLVIDVGGIEGITHGQNARLSMLLLVELRDRILAAFIFPLAFTVGLSFWLMYAIDREMIYPRELDAYIPRWLNHVLHTAIMVFVVLDMGDEWHRYPQLQVEGLRSLWTFFVVYAVWVHVVRAITGEWPYPVLEYVSFAARMVFLASVMALASALYVMGDWMNAKLWKEQMIHRAAMDGAYAGSSRAYYCRCH